MDLYQAQIVDLAKNPIHRGELEDATVTHSGVNLTCGDHVRLYLKLEGDRIEKVTWEGEGCAISVAAVCLLCEELKGKTLDEVKAFTNQSMFEFLGIDELGPARVKCAVLCLETAQGALLKLNKE
jgi:nitrogen fixation protein NifU and related proteins